VLWQAAEDDWGSVVVPRLIAAGAVIERVGRLDVDAGFGRRRRLVLPDDEVILSDAIREAGVSLLVLDPYISLAGTNLDVRIEQQARAYLEPVGHMLANTRCTGLLTRHIRKGSSGDARDSGLGSVAVGNVARGVIRCDEHPHESGKHVLSCVAVNHGRKRSTMVYSIESGAAEYPRIRWHGDCALDADAIAEGRGSEADRDEWTEADQLLVVLIQNGWTQVCTILADAERAGISPRMIRRAKARLGIPSRRVGYGPDGTWQWGAPLAGWPAGLAIPGTNGVHVPAGAPMAPMEDPCGKEGNRPRTRAHRRPRAHVPPPATPVPDKEEPDGDETTTA
jgi:hypothetical protein